MPKSTDIPEFRICFSQCQYPLEQKSVTSLMCYPWKHVGCRLKVTLFKPHVKNLHSIETKYAIKITYDISTEHTTK